MSIADRLTELANAKNNIKAAIESKGVSPTGGLSTYADAIRSIETGGVVTGGLDFSPLDYNNGLINASMTALQDAIEYGDYISKNIYRSAPSQEYSPSLNETKILHFNTQNNKKLLFFPDVQLSNINYVDGWETMLFLDSALISIGNIIMDSKRTSPHWDVSYMFCGCANLKCVGGIELRNTRILHWVFFGCSNLNNLPAFDCSGLEQMSMTFNGCSSLENIGGFINLGKVIATGPVGYGFDIHSTTFRNCKNISRQSMLNIFNGLYDISNVEYSTDDISTTLYFESSVLSRLSDEDKAIAINKGWTLSAINS